MTNTGPIPVTVGFMDIGTNSIRLLVVRYASRRSSNVLLALKETVRLGEDEFSDRKLRPAAMDRAVQVVRQFAAQALEFGASEVVAVATSATREAANQQQFLDRLRDEAGVEVHVISGQEEARLIYLGVISGAYLGGKQAFLIDIGGGSTEVSIATSQEYLYLNSLKMGAIRLSTQFLNHQEGTISNQAYERLRRFIRSEASVAISEMRAFKIDLAYGSSGTIENLADIAANLIPGARRDLLRFAHLETVIARLRAMTVAERRNVPGLNPGRADIIIGGAAILHVLMEELELGEIRISTRGLREGLVVDYQTRHIGHSLEADAVRRNSVQQLGRRCNYNETHAETTARLALSLFDTARDAGLHRMGQWERELLEYAALLHHIGGFLTYANYQKHSEYLIRNAELLGFDEQETNVLAMVVLHHRNGLPRKREHNMVTMPSRLREVVRALAMFLRLAENLDVTQTGVVEDARFERIGGSRVVLRISARQGWRADLWGMEAQIAAFKKTFDKQLVIETVPARMEVASA